VGAQSGVAARPIPWVSRALVWQSPSPVLVLLVCNSSSWVICSRRSIGQRHVLLAQLGPLCRRKPTRAPGMPGSLFLREPVPFSSSGNTLCLHSSEPRGNPGQGSSQLSLTHSQTELTDLRELRITQHGLLSSGRTRGRGCAAGTLPVPGSTLLLVCW